MPNQIENEKAIIGAILQEPERVLALCQKKRLTKDAFKTVEWRNAYRGALHLLEKNQPIDAVTLATLIKTSPSNLSTCLDDSIWTHTESYIEALLHSDTKRRLLEFPSKITEAIRQDQHPQDVIQNTISDLQSIQKSTEINMFPPIRYDDLVSYKTPEGHIIAGLGWLRRGSGCLLTGGTSLGKSILATQIAIDIASGQNILGCIKVPSPMRVTYFQAENDEETLQRDVLSIVKHTNANPVLVNQNLAIHHVFGLSGSSLDQFVNQELTKQHTDLFILDPYQDFIPAGMNINDASTFLTFIFNLNRIIKERNCAFLLVTHTPKPQDREHWTARESVYMAVGSQAIAAWARTSAEITGFKDDDSTYRLRFGKNAERTGVVNDNGGIVRDLIIQHSPSIHEPYWKVSDNQEEPSKSKFKSEIIRCATDFPDMSQRDIAKEVGCSTGLVAKYDPRKK